jgi:hypothetical protein
MNLLQRLIGLWWTLWAWAKVPEAARPAALPEGTVPQRTNAAGLLAEAARQGVADARSGMYDPFLWRDGVEQDFVLALRGRRDAAERDLQSAQVQTESRLGPLRTLRDEAGSRMRDAMRKMTGLAERDDLVRIRAFEAGGPDAAPAGGPAPAPAAAGAGPGPGEDVPWEGETIPLRMGWRLLILGVLLGAEVVVQYYVFDFFVGGSTSAAMIRWLAVSAAAVLVLGPFLAGAVLRLRAGTGSDHRIGRVTLVLTAAWAAAAATSGLVRGTVFQAARPAGAPAHVTSVTVVTMFMAMLLVIGSMAFMLGLSRRHPYQEAYLRHRNRRDRLDAFTRFCATRINPSYLEDADQLDDEIESIRAAFAAAENTYYASLCRTAGDPAFTESVQRRHGVEVTT